MACKQQSPALHGPRIVPRAAQQTLFPQDRSRQPAEPFRAFLRHDVCRLSDPYARSPRDAPRPLHSRLQRHRNGIQFPHPPLGLQPALQTLRPQDLGANRPLSPPCRRPLFHSPLPLHPDSCTFGCISECVGERHIK